MGVSEEDEQWPGANETTLDYEGPAPSTAGEGDQLGRYRLGEVLGAGGMGHVHRAHDPKLQRDVAIKLVHRSSARSHHRMRREAQAMAQLSHPNVLPIYDVAEQEGQLFIAMELVEGMTLRQWLRAKPRKWPEVLDMFMRAGRGLQAAHEVGLVHRDFNLRNVLVGYDGRVRVMDFGLARPCGDESMFDLTSGPVEGESPRAIGEVTEPGMVMGTPAYMAPEQYIGKSVGLAADQYAFCTALWEGLCGHRPYSEEGTHAYLFKLKTQGPPRAADQLEGVPVEIHTALEKGLAAKAQDRFSSMEALLAALTPRRSKPPRRAVESLAALGVGVALVATGMMSREHPPACDGTDALAEVWGQRHKAEAEQALLATEVVYAAQTWERLETRLDAYADRWVEEHRAVCLASGGEQAQTRVLDARSRCLDDRRQALDALVRTLSEADEATVGRAIDAAHRLPDPARCAQSDVFPADQSEPDDPQLAQQVQQARQTLARVEALYRAGRYEDAASQATALQARTEDLDFPPLSVDVAVLQGQALAHDSDPTALKILEQAYFDALGHSLDRRAGKIAIVLVRQYGIVLEQPDEAERWIGHARGLMDRLDEPELLASFHMGVGEALHSAGKTQEALDHKERGLKLVTELYEPDHPLRVSADMGVGSIHAHLGHYEQALEHLDHALTVVEQTRGPQHPHVAELLHSIGDVQRQQGQLEQARSSLERALEINEAVFGPSHNKVAASLHNLGLFAMKAGELERADRLMTRSLEIRETLFGPQHPLVGRILMNLGIVADLREQDDRALRLLERARQITDAAYGPKHQLMAGVLNQMGNIHALRGNFEDAVAAFSGAAEACEASFGPTHPNTVGVRKSLDKARIALRDGAPPS
ncbi:MAG: serine/threonine-protein kinase [Myxococcota bacterium]